MLKSAGYPLPKKILVHDFLSLNGQKISKSLGNVIRPSELVKQFGVDGVRYYFLRYGPLTNDVDISIDKIKEVYNADLANGLGNLVSRIAKLCQSANINIKAVLKTTAGVENKLVRWIPDPELETK
jgi:methionyl-tRNA synthetase